jgi:hypothetical protein
LSRLHLKKTISFYQDRLATNTGNTQLQDRFSSGDAGNLGAIYGGDGSGKVVPKNSSAVPLIDALRARGISASHATGE